MFRSLLFLLLGLWFVGVPGSSVFGGDSLLKQLPDTTPIGKPHFDSKGAKVGDQLPNLPVYRLDGKPAWLGQAWAGQTTLLLTSSYTCPKSRATYPSAAKLAKRLSAMNVRVSVIYVIEAHPAGDPSPYTGTEEVTPENRRDRILCRQPTTLDDRLKLARAFSQRLEVEAPMFIDAMDNAAWMALGGGPNMGVLVDADGIVLARQGWFDAKSMGTAIDAFVASLPKPAPVGVPDQAARDAHYTLYQLVASNKASEVKTLLEQQPNLERQFEQSGETLLQKAAKDGAIDVLKLLIERGADVNRQTQAAAPPLNLAAGRGLLNVVQFLLAHGAKVNGKPQSRGPTALQEALLAGKSDIAAALIRAGAKPNFYTAAATGDLAALRKAFLADMTVLSRPDGRGRSALVYAAKTGHIDSAKLLIALGARDYPDDPYGRIAAWYAVRARNLELSRLLLDAGSNPNLFGVAIDADAPLDFVRLLLGHKADPNADDGVRPLHRAAGYGRQDMMQLLLDAGADVNATLKESNGLMCGLSYYKGDTPLHVAIENQQEGAAELLLKHGAKVDASTESGATPLHLAAADLAYTSEDAQQAQQAQRMVALLIERHADINAQDKEGRTPLDYATR